MHDFHFDRDTHTYTLGGVVLPSVTTIIRPVSPDFDGIPAMVLERKRALGQAVHLACELLDADELGEFDPVLEPYLRAWEHFKIDTRALVLMSEQQLAHRALRYAGTLDRLLTISGEPWMIDLKTSTNPHPVYGVQTAAYEELRRANEGEEARAARVRRATVHLRADGTYRLHEYSDPNDFAVFRALLSVHHWKENHK